MAVAFLYRGRGIITAPSNGWDGYGRNGFDGGGVGVGASTDTDAAEAKAYENGSGRQTKVTSYQDFVL